MKKVEIYFLLVLSLYSQITKAQFFTKITGTPIASDLKDTRSVNWIDVNNEGKIDLFFSNGPSGGQNNSLFLNTAPNSFSLMSNDQICQDMSPSDGATFADVDNDGNIDAFIVNWYNQNNLFYTNSGNGTFLKNTSEIISNDLGYSETAAWGDYDNDGLVDLYVTNSAGSKKNYLYHNDGNLNFSKITLGNHVNDAYSSRNVNWVDIDSDGDLDLFVTNENNQNENIYRNDGQSGFTKLTAGPLSNNGGNTNSSSWADIDNDGDLDVVLINDQGYNSLFKNNGDFNFSKVLDDTLVKTPSRSFSSAWSDIDNDGDLDLFITNSFGTSLKQLNFLFLNDGAGNFTRNTVDAAVNDSSWSYGCAFGDYDNDGFEDLAVATVRFGTTDYGDFLYRNNGNSNNWITIKLKGTISNKSAIGAKIRIKATLNGIPKWQMREITSHSSYNGQNDLRAHFGLGNTNLIDSVKIEWPSRLIERYSALTSNQFVEFIEGSTYVDIKEKSVELKTDLISYPNPTKGSVQIKLMNKNMHKGDLIKLVNMQGQTVFTFELNQNENSVTINLDRNTINPGLYLLVLERENKANYLNKLVITN